MLNLCYYVKLCYSVLATKAPRIRFRDYVSRFTELYGLLFTAVATPLTKKQIGREITEACSTYLPRNCYPNNIVYVTMVAYH